MREGRHLRSYQRSGRYALWGTYQKQWKWQKVECGQVSGVPKKGRRAGRGGAPQFMIAPCQSANERTLLLFIEIRLAIDASRCIEPLLMASPDLACPLYQLFFARRIRDKELLLTILLIAL